MSETTTQTLEPLILPTDKKILNALTHGLRETPRNLSAQLTDVTNTYTGDRLRALEHRGYTNSPGPADRSGMYQITTWGRFATTHINKYDRNHDKLFHALTVRSVNSQPTPPDISNHTNPNTETQHPAPDPHNHTKTDWIHLYPHELNALNALNDINGITIPTDFRNHITTDNPDTNPPNANDASELLYTLYYYDLADRHDGMEAYSINDTGRKLLNTNPDPAHLQKGGTRTDILNPD